MKVYVAGASKELPRVREAMSRLRKEGIEITHDWTVEVERAGTANDCSSEDARRYAQADLVGVAAADIFWMLVPGNASAGAWVELGYTLRMVDSDYNATAPDPIVSGQLEKSIFCALAKHTFVDDLDALMWILNEHCARVTGKPIPDLSGYDGDGFAALSGPDQILVRGRNIDALQDAVAKLGSTGHVAYTHAHVTYMGLTSLPEAR